MLAEKPPTEKDMSDLIFFRAYVYDLINGGWYNFYLHWLDSKSDKNINNIIDVTTICNMINHIRTWSEDIPIVDEYSITPECVINTYAYMYAMILLCGKSLHRDTPWAKLVYPAHQNESWAKLVYRAHQNDDVSDLCPEQEEQYNVSKNDIEGPEENYIEDENNDEFAIPLRRAHQMYEYDLKPKEDEFRIELDYPTTSHQIIYDWNRTV